MGRWYQRGGMPDRACALLGLEPRFGSRCHPIDLSVAGARGPNLLQCAFIPLLWPGFKLGVRDKCAPHGSLPVTDKVSWPFALQGRLLDDVQT